MKQKYECIRCGYTCKRKRVLKRHFLRKFPCKEKKAKISTNHLLKINNMVIDKDNSDILCGAQKIAQNTLIMTQKHNKITDSHHNFTTSHHKSKIPHHKFTTSHHNLTTNSPHTTTKKPNIHQCPYCKHNYSRIDSLNRHISKFCKVKITQESKDFEMSEDSEGSEETLTLTKKEWENKLDNHKKELTEQFANQIEALTQKFNSYTMNQHNTNSYNTTNQSHNTSKQNNITLNNYGSENIDYITEKHLTYLIKRPGIALRRLIENIHFNPDHPENHNIKATNSRSKLIQVNKDKNWLFRNKKDVINELIENNVTVLEDHYSKVQGKLPYYKQKKFENSMINIETCPIAKKNLELTLLNGTKKIH